MTQPDPNNLDCIAILTSDWHMWHVPPVARSAEDNWWAAQSRPLDEIKRLQESMPNRPPVIVAGDLTDRWNCSPELLTWMMVNIPDNCWAIPGNHDLPWGSWKERKRSGFWTLIESGRLNLLDPRKPNDLGNLIVHAFPHGFDPKPLRKPKGNALVMDVAVIHAYCYSSNQAHPQAKREDHWQGWVKRLTGYDALAFGDNHAGFLRTGWTHPVANCGTLMRRKQDERHLEPSAWLLHLSGEVTRHKLDCSQDRFIDAELAAKLTEDGIDAAAFVAELERLGDSALDFREAVKHALNGRGIGKAARRVVLEIMETCSTKGS